jgi:hypothetical protein
LMGPGDTRSMAFGMRAVMPTILIVAAMTTFSETSFGWRGVHGITHLLFAQAAPLYTSKRALRIACRSLNFGSCRHAGRRSCSRGDRRMARSWSVNRPDRQ